MIRPPPNSSATRFQTVLPSWTVLFVSIALGLAAALANRGQLTDSAGRISLVDGDCYARMTRVRAVCVNPGTVLRHHNFENYPAGTTPHTTVPLDYLTAGLRTILGVLRFATPRELAGAWIAPLLGVLAIVGAWLWTARSELPGSGGWIAPLVFSGSPIIAHGFAFGRPDHQSLEMTCVAFALAAEWSQWRRPSRGWGMVAGFAWSLGLWTSLYEPLFLLAAVLVAGWVFNRPALLRRERLPGLILFGAVLLAALLVEGWRVVEIPGFGPAETGAAYFAAWSRQIGELQSVPPWSPTLYHWTGWGILLAPVALLAARGELRPLARAQLLLLALVFALTCWQVRWGYFLPLVYVISLPAQFAAVPGRWRVLAGVALLAGGWPLASEWWTRAHPAPEVAALLAEQREDASLLRDVAAFLERRSAEGGPDRRGILAPWWLSPALAYWSRQPAVAGSSHESLPGIVDTARFYLATDPREAAEILRARRVRWVVAYEPERVAATAAPLLGRPAAARSLCVLLYDRPALAPPFLRLALVNPYFKVYEVQPSLLPP